MVGSGAGGETRSALRGRVRRVLKRISQTGELPTLPPAVTAALAIARDPDADVAQLCRAIGADVGIAARVLRVASSAIYARRTRCQTLQEAVRTVGLRGIQDMLAAAALGALFDLRDPTARRLWDHALATSLAAEEIAQRLSAGRRGEVFLPALFHDLGRIVFFLTDPQAYTEMSARELESDTPRVDLERAWYGFDHGEAGAAVAVDWGMPSGLCDALRTHHAPARATSGRSLADLIGLADELAYIIGLGASSRPATSRLATVLTPHEVNTLADRVRATFEAERALFR